MQFSVNAIPLYDGMIIEVEGSCRACSVPSHSVWNFGSVVLSSSNVNTANRAARQASEMTDGSEERTATTSIVCSRYGNSDSTGGSVTNGGENILRHGNFSARS